MLLAQQIELMQRIDAVIATRVRPELLDGKSVRIGETLQFFDRAIDRIDEFEDARCDREMDVLRPRVAVSLGETTASKSGWCAAY